MLGLALESFEWHLAKQPELNPLRISSRSNESGLQRIYYLKLSGQKLIV